MRKLGLLGVGAAFAFGGGATAAIVGGAIAGGGKLATAIKGGKQTAFDFFRKGAVNAALIFSTGVARSSQAAEAEQIKALRRARGRPDVVSIDEDFKFDPAGFVKRKGLVTEDTANAALTVTLESNKAVGQGFGTNSLGVAMTEARRAFGTFRGSDANRTLARTIDTMEDRFNREIQSNWKVGSRKGG